MRGILSRTKASKLNIQYIGSTSNSNILTTYTFNSVNFGSTITYGTRNIAAVVMGCTDTVSGNVSTVSIGGTTATRIVQSNTGGVIGRSVEIWYIENNVLTSGTVTFTFSSQNTHAALAIYQINNPDSITPQFSTSSIVNTVTGTIPIQVKSNGVGLGICSSNFSASNYSFTNLTEDFDFAAKPAQNAYVAGGICNGGTSGEGTYDVTFTRTGTTNITALTASWI